jgi:hypothetical protein
MAWVKTALPVLFVEVRGAHRVAASPECVEYRVVVSILAHSKCLPLKVKCVPLCTSALLSNAYDVAVAEPLLTEVRRNEMTPAKADKCAHPVCSCLTTSGKYCSTECEAMEKTPDIDCLCGHTGCKGKTS